jgi:multiple sugar transport system substrate-binding protein
MQPFYPPIAPVYSRRRFLAGAILAPVGIAAGCVERPTTIDKAPDRPHAGVSLSIAVADPADRDLVRQIARSWAIRSGATVTVTDAAFDGTSDIGLIPPAEMPRWADAAKLAAVPAAIKEATHPYKWTDLFPVYMTRALTWRGTAYALPVTAEGLVLVYRTDAFAHNKPPQSWEELLEAAKRLGPNSLPPVPASAVVRGAEFFSAAASFDAQVVNRLVGGQVPGDSFYQFQFDPADGRPRLEDPAFGHVAKLLAEMAKFRCPDGSPAAAFKDGRAKVGVMTLADLGQVGSATADRLGVAPLPGAKTVFERGARHEVPQGGVNRVPYVAWGGRVGVVSAASPNAAAAWDFLTDLGLPEGTALDLIASPKWGAGPYRPSQVDSRVLSRWAGYELSANQTNGLMIALRDNVGPGVQNSRLRLRTPNQAEFETALDAELEPLMKGTKPADKAMAAANKRWEKIVEPLGPEWRAMYRRSLGLG